MQDVLQHLLRLGALADVPDDLQWTARMLLPKNAACPPPVEPRNPRQRPAIAAPTPAVWAPEPNARVSPRDPLVPAARADVSARVGAPPAASAEVVSLAVQPLPLPAGLLGRGVTQQRSAVRPMRSSPI